MMPFLRSITIPGGGATALPLVLTYAAYSVSDVNQSSPFTFLGTYIGVASADRNVMACISVSTGDSTISSITIGGQSCTVLQFKSAQAATAIAITNAPITTGTSANVVVNYSTGVTATAICHTYALTGPLGSRTATSSASISENAAGSYTATPLGLTIPAGGIIIGVYASVSNTGTGSGSGSWSGLTQNNFGNATVAYGSAASLASNTSSSVAISSTVTDSFYGSFLTAAYR